MKKNRNGKVEFLLFGLRIYLSSVLEIKTYDKNIHIYLFHLMVVQKYIAKIAFFWFFFFTCSIL